ncbi:hypothetical protein HMI56_003614 [Coelomomyces lativittatus]|nr:hypothetical protein HMI56_003614 [Coelomomyces lativittatus]
MVATKALPDSFLRVQSLVKQLPLSTHSKYFPTTECVPFIPSITLTSTSSPTLPMSTTTTTTTTTVSSSSSISYQDHPPPTDPDTQTPPFFSSPPPLHVASPRSRSRFPFMRSLFPPMVRRCMKYASPILFGLALMMFLAQRRQPGHFGGFRKLIHHVLLRWVRKV